MRPIVSANSVFRGLLAVCGRFGRSSLRKCERKVARSDSATDSKHLLQECLVTEGRR